MSKSYLLFVICYLLFVICYPSTGSACRLGEGNETQHLQLPVTITVTITVTS